jgi:hypothetical protein
LQPDIVVHLPGGQQVTGPLRTWKC